LSTFFSNFVRISQLTWVQNAILIIVELIFSD